ncbi:MAG: ATP-binding protein [Methanoregulaceae archaeon]|jgi:light-regulated signal transduction histidine kinase (bacteriophytochrome)
MDLDPARTGIGSYFPEGITVHFVRNNGVGLAGTLFPVFQGLHDEKEYVGAGIGLAIIHRIIERHGGIVWLRSRWRAGGLFFPVTREEYPS